MNDDIGYNRMWIAPFVKLEQPKTHGYIKEVKTDQPSIWFRIFEVIGILAWIYVIVRLIG